MKKILGVGINDADYAVVKFKTVGYDEGGQKQKLDSYCPYYRVWLAMLNRCYSQSSKHTTYSDCSVCPEWLTFSVFKEWMKGQNWEGLELDKDVLIYGNRLYCPTACRFVPPFINCPNLINLNNKNGLPAGVSYSDLKKNPFTTKILIDGKVKKLGVFRTSLLAHNAWQLAKASVIENAVVVYSKQSSFLQEIAEVLLKRAEQLRADSLAGIETKSYKN